MSGHRIIGVMRRGAARRRRSSAVRTAGPGPTTPSTGGLLGFVRWRCGSSPTSTPSMIALRVRLSASSVCTAAVACVVRPTPRSRRQPTPAATDLWTAARPAHPAVRSAATGRPTGPTPAPCSGLYCGHLLLEQVSHPASGRPGHERSVHRHRRTSHIGHRSSPTENASIRRTYIDSPRPFGLSSCVRP